MTAGAVASIGRWLGVVRPVHPWIGEVTADSIRHVALALGDDRRPSEHAPAALGYAIVNGGPGAADEVLPVLDGAGGLDAVIAGDTWLWHRPLRVGDRPKVTATITEMHEIERPGRPPALLVTEEIRILDASGGAIAELAHRSHLSAPSGEPAEEGADHADAEQRAEAASEQRDRPASAVRDPASTRVGDRLSRLAYGPLAVEHLILWLAATGSTTPWLDRVALRARERHPGAFVPDPLAPGLLTPREREHFGGPDRTPFDFGSQRVAWFAAAIEHWSGPYGRLTGLDVRLRRPNRLGDITWIDGAVEAVEQSPAGSVARIRAIAADQHGTVTATASATVLLTTPPAGAGSRPGGLR